MGRIPCCDKVGVKKGPWTPEEDHLLVSYIQKNGLGKWRTLPKYAGLPRCGKSCRFRWTNYLRPDVKRGNYSKEEEDTIIRLHAELGNKWSKIAANLPGRTDNEIKNVWTSKLRKRVLVRKESKTSRSSLVKPTVTEITHSPRSSGNFSRHMEYYVNPQHDNDDDSGGFNPNEYLMESNIITDGCSSATAAVLQSQLQPDHDRLKLGPAAFDGQLDELTSSLFADNYLCSSSLQSCDEPRSFWSNLWSYAVENGEAQSLF